MNLFINLKKNIFHSVSYINLVLVELFADFLVISFENM